MKFYEKIINTDMKHFLTGKAVTTRMLSKKAAGNQGHLKKLC